MSYEQGAGVSHDMTMYITSLNCLPVTEMISLNRSRDNIFNGLSQGEVTSQYKSIGRILQNILIFLTMATILLVPPIELRYR